MDKVYSFLMIVSICVHWHLAGLRKYFHRDLATRPGSYQCLLGSCRKRVPEKVVFWPGDIEIWRCRPTLRSLLLELGYAGGPCVTNMGRGRGLMTRCLLLFQKWLSDTTPSRS